ncbi:MAG: hypothetical protein WCT37_04955 [Patescibacteria group bacterium]|jgi:hypothetical protein
MADKTNPASDSSNNTNDQNSETAEKLRRQAEADERELKRMLGDHQRAEAKLVGKADGYRGIF